MLLTAHTGYTTEFDKEIEEWKIEQDENSTFEKI